MDVAGSEHDRSAMTHTPPWRNAGRRQAVVTCAGIVLTVVLAMFLYRSLPPRTVIMATDHAGGIYGQLALRYQEIFARHGVRLELLATHGSVDNVGQLRDRQAGVGVAFVQSGVTNAVEAPELVSLGTLFYEPFWLFSRDPQANRSAMDREGLRMSLGIPGSGTYKHARELAAAVGIDLSRARVSDLDANQAGEALLKGEIDMVVMMLPLEAPVVHQLFVHDSITAYEWQRADAHVALRPYLSKLVVPRGVADLPRDRPAKDLTLVATKTSLVVRRDLHPAIQFLLLEAASEVHGAPGVFSKAGEFPAAEPIDLPLSTTAREYYRSGQPFLQRLLPFWLAALASPLMILVPVGGILYPLFSLGPAVIRWVVHNRIFRVYNELKFLEAELEVSASDRVTNALSDRLNRLEERADHLNVPKAYMHMLYTLKQHISLVRQRLRDKRPGTSESLHEREP